MIEAALRPVLADIAATEAPVPRITDDRWDPELQSTVRFLREDGSGAGVGVERALGPAERIVQAADRAQEWVVETLWRDGRSASWPGCPAHPTTHPLEAALLDGAPVWRCPAGAAVAVPIGSLRRL